MLCFLVHICVPCLLWFRLPALRLIGLKRVLNVFTLYSWMTPFCISLGGGSQETLTPEELLSFTVAAVTALGGALGTVKRREAINILIHANCEWNTQCTRKMQCCEQICYVKKSDKISRVFVCLFSHLLQSFAPVTSGCPCPGIHQNMDGSWSHIQFL